MYAGKAHDSDRHTAGRDQGKGQVFHTFRSVAVFQPFADAGKQYQSQSITDSGADSVKQTLPECIVFLDIDKATPKIAQLVVMSGRNTPMLLCSAGSIFLMNISTSCTKERDRQNKSTMVFK